MVVGDHDDVWVSVDSDVEDLLRMGGRQIRLSRIRGWVEDYGILTE